MDLDQKSPPEVEIPTQISVYRVERAEVAFDGATSFEVDGSPTEPGTISIDIPGATFMTFVIDHVHRQIGPAVPVRPGTYKVTVECIDVPNPGVTWQTVQERLDKVGLWPGEEDDGGVRRLAWHGVIEELLDVLGLLNRPGLFIGSSRKGRNTRAGRSAARARGDRPGRVT